MQFGTISKSSGLFLKLEYRRWTSHPKTDISVLYLKMKISILCNLILFLNATLSLKLKRLFLLLKDKCHFVICYEWLDVFQWYIVQCEEQIVSWQRRRVMRKQCSVWIYFGMLTSSIGEKLADVIELQDLAGI